MPNLNLDNVFVASVEGDAGGAGAITQVYDLTGTTLGSNGLLVIKASTGGFTIPAATTVVTTTTMDSGSGALQNGSNSFLVIFSPASAVTNGTDLDTNNDGTIDNLPAGATVVDGAGVLDATAGGGTVYGAVVSQTTGAPNAITRFASNSTPFDSAAFYGGFLDSGAGNTSITYSQTNPDTHSANLPADAVLTPGDANFPTGSDTTPPTVDNFNFNFLTGPQSVTVHFSEPVQGLSSSTITLHNDTQSTDIPTPNISYGISADQLVLTFPGYANGTLPDGDYTLTVSATGVSDLAGNPLNGGTNYTMTFYFLNGDANHDRHVNLLDFNILAGNFNQSRAILRMATSTMTAR